ncbi:MAG: PH domain-containing protein [Balneolaceae bacterium]|nr:PH domain-containing protein [Balneolaceae bacterium]
MGIFSGLMGNAGVVEPETLNDEYHKLLTESEHIEVGFKLVRDLFIFTNKRLILVNKQGVTGKKVEYLSLAYGSISRFSIESNGTFDLDAELKIWISSSPAPAVTQKFNKKVNIYAVQKTLANYVLN